MRTLGIDYGERRIGLSLSDATGLLASPWKTLAHDANVGAAATRIAREIASLDEGDRPQAIVIGLPRRLNGEPNQQTPRVEKFAAALRDLTSLPIALQDERLTSLEADAILAQRERDWRKRKANLDAMAAAVILQDYLDTQPRR